MPEGNVGHVALVEHFDLDFRIGLFERRFVSSFGKNVMTVTVPALALARLRTSAIAGASRLNMVSAVLRFE
jgi:hypothetical protein